MSGAVQASGNLGFPSSIYNLLGCGEQSSMNACVSQGGTDEPHTVQSPQQNSIGPATNEVAEANTGFFGTLRKVCIWSINFFLKIGSLISECIGNYIKNCLEGRNHLNNDCSTSPNIENQEGVVFQSNVNSTDLSSSNEEQQSALFVATIFHSSQNLEIYPAPFMYIPPAGRLSWTSQNLSVLSPSEFNVNSVRSGLSGNTSTAVAPSLASSIHNPDQNVQLELESILECANQAVTVVLDNNRLLKGLIFGNTGNQIAINLEGLSTLLELTRQQQPNQDGSLQVNDNTDKSQLGMILSTLIAGNIMEPIFDLNVDIQKVSANVVSETNLSDHNVHTLFKDEHPSHISLPIIIQEHLTSLNIRMQILSSTTSVDFNPSQTSKVIDTNQVRSVDKRSQNNTQVKEQDDREYSDYTYWHSASQNYMNQLKIF